MSFLKAFGISFIVFIGLNIVFFLIGYLIIGTLDVYFQSITSTPSNILLLIFGPIVSLQFPAILISQVGYWIGGMPFEVGALILFIGFIIAPLVAAILSGRFGENKIEAFGGWFAAVMISALVVIIWFLIDLIGIGAPIETIFSLVLTYIGIGLIYGFGYGCISLLLTKEI